MDQDDQVFETHDIYLAAYFKVAGCKLARTYNQGRRVYFVFSNPAGPAGSMRELREAFYSGNASVEARKYASEIQSMKQLCFQDK